MNVDFRGAYHKLADKLEHWRDTVILMLPNLVVAIIALALFLVAARFARLGVAHVLARLGMKEPGRSLVSRALHVTILVTGIFVVLSVLSLDKAATSMLAGAGIIGVILGFALQDIASNFMAGVYMSMRLPFRLGDVIETQDVFGTAERVLLRTSLIRTQQGQLVMIPNRELFTKKLTNYTFYGIRRIDLDCRCSYGDDLAKVEAVARAAVEEVTTRDPSRNVEVFFKEFGESGIDFMVRFWIPFHKQVEYYAGKSEAILRLRQAFLQHGLTIPFPIRQLHFEQPKEPAPPSPKE